MWEAALGVLETILLVFNSFWSFVIIIGGSFFNICTLSFSNLGKCSWLVSHYFFRIYICVGKPGDSVETEEASP